MKSITHKKLTMNLLYNGGYQILMLIVPLITSPYISRVLGASGMGEYGYTYSVANFFVLITMLGVLNYGNREISRVKDDPQKLTSAFWGIYTVQFSVGIISILCYFIYLVYFCHEYKLVFMAQILYLFGGLLNISWFYFGIEQFKATTIISAVNKLMTTILIFLIVKDSSHVYLYTLIITSGYLLNQVTYWLYLRKFIKCIDFNISESKKHIIPMIGLFIPVIAVSVYKYMDKIMLKILIDSSEVGYYEAAEKFLNLPLSIITAIGTVMLPRITNMKEKSMIQDIKRYNFLSMIMIMFLSFGIAFGLAGIADVFIPWFYGEDFLLSSNVLKLLLPSIVFVSWANIVRTQCLLPNKRDREYSISVIFGAIINFIINIMLIPKHGAQGAAIGTTIAEISVCLIQSFITRKSMEFIKYLKYTFPFIVTSFLMYFIIQNITIGNILYTILLRIGIGIMIYFIMSLIFIKNGFNQYIKETGTK